MDEAAAGITDSHFHDLRHTFASRRVMSGADPMTPSWNQPLST